MPSMFPIDLPPGVVKNGTVYQTKGRWFDTQLVRWFSGAMQPVGGWDHIQDTGGADVTVTGRPVGMFTWANNAGAPFVAIGTEQKLIVYSQGTETDATPVGFTTGSTDGQRTSGQYGKGAYGGGPYGKGTAAEEQIVPVDTWSFDNQGEDLVAVYTADNIIYSWDSSAGGAATALSGDASLPICNALVITPEGFLFALGSDLATTNIDPRQIQWTDQDDFSTWAPAIGNQAGDQVLRTNGEILAGRAARNETLIWTTVDLWSASYIAGDFIYSFRRVGQQCGAISPNSMAVVDGRAVWMGNRKFYQYDGFVQPVPCPLSDFIFSDLNRTQASKIFAMVNSEFNEIWWFYPSAGSSENDRYVVWNYVDNFWFNGSLERTAGADRGAFTNPLMADASGNIYKHEEGTDYEDPDDNALTPDAESGPYEIGNGDRLMEVESVIPDETTLGDMQVEFLTSIYPTEDETTQGPFTAGEPTDARFTARQARLRVTQVNPGWRLGAFRVLAEPGSRR